jgi:hypothetical protein
VRRDREPVRPSGERLVDVADVGLVLVLGVAADRAHVLALSGIVEVGEARVVELEVAATGRGDAPHLLGVGRGQVGPELVEVGIELGVDRGAAAAVVDHARRRDRQLRRLLGPGDRAQELEGVAEDRLRQPDPAVDAQRRRRELERPGLVAELHVQRLVDDLRDPVEAVDEVHVPGRAPELAVGDRAQAAVALERDDVADRRVLGLPQAVGAERARREPLARREQLRRAQQAADVVGAERRRLARRHQIG